jgi:DNA-directed RNA polymerase subunit RPC12/RpoP
MSLKTFQLNLSNLRPWLTLLAVTWLLGSLGLGWLVNSLLIIVGILLLTPLLVFFTFRWWLQYNSVSDRCPVCSYQFTGLNNSQLRCPNCGEQLLVQHGHFQRLTPEGTIDIKAIEVPSIED